MIYIGIDVGKKGGIAVIFEDNIEVYPYSDDKLMYICSKAKALEITRKEQTFCVVEKVGAMHGQGVTSMFNFGKSFGYILGVLEAYKISYQLVNPQIWKKEFNLIKKDKAESIKTCKRLYPDISLLPTARCSKENDGMAEALLICTYAKRLSK